MPEERDAEAFNDALARLQRGEAAPGVPGELAGDLEAARRLAASEAAPPAGLKGRIKARVMMDQEALMIGNKDSKPQLPVEWKVAAGLAALALAVGLGWFLGRSGGDKEAGGAPFLPSPSGQASGTGAAGGAESGLAMIRGGGGPVESTLTVGRRGGALATREAGGELAFGEPEGGPEADAARRGPARQFPAQSPVQQRPAGAVGRQANFQPRQGAAGQGGGTGSGGGFGSGLSAGLGAAPAALKGGAAPPPQPRIERPAPKITKLPRLAEPARVKDPILRKVINGMKLGAQRLTLGAPAEGGRPGSSAGAATSIGGSAGVTVTGTGASNRLQANTPMGGGGATGEGPTGGGAIAGGGTGGNAGGGTTGTPDEAGTGTGTGTAGTGTTGTGTADPGELDENDGVGPINNNQAPSPATMKRDADGYMKAEYDLIVNPSAYLAKKVAAQYLQQVRQAAAGMDRARERLVADTAAGGLLRLSPLTTALADTLQNELLPILDIAGKAQERRIEPIRYDLSEAEKDIEAMEDLAEEYLKADRNVSSLEETLFRRTAAWVSARGRYYDMLWRLRNDPTYVVDTYLKRWEELKTQCQTCIDACQAAAAPGTTVDCNAQCNDQGCLARDNVYNSGIPIAGHLEAAYKALETSPFAGLTAEERELAPHISSGTGNAQTVLARFVNNYKNGAAVGWKLKPGCERVFLKSVLDAAVEWGHDSWIWAEAATQSNKDDSRAEDVVSGFGTALVARKSTKRAHAMMMESSCMPSEAAP